MLEQRHQSPRVRLARHAQGFIEVLPGLLRLTTSICDMRHHAKKMGPVLASRGGVSERLAEDAVGVGPAARNNESLRQLSREYEDRRCGIIDLVAMDLLSRDIESCSQGVHAAMRVAMSSATCAQLIEERKRLECAPPVHR